jgi:hypothetical protein
MKSGAAPRMAAQVLLSFFLCCATLFLIKAINYLPYSPSRDTLSDFLGAPGALIAGLFYPEGVHTGRGSPGWAYVAFTGNAAVYGAVWFLLIRLLGRIVRYRTH